MHEEWLARGVPTAWRKCTRCAKKKLMNSDNFTSKPKNYLGLSYQCKGLRPRKTRGEKEWLKNHARYARKFMMMSNLTLPLSAVSGLALH